MKAIFDFFDKFVTYLTPGHVEGFLLFSVSTIIMTVIQWKFKDEWTTGLKGMNGLWEGPEILLYIWLWIAPPMIFSSGFLGTVYPDWAWWTLWIGLLVGVFGRWGLEWLLAFKTGQSSVTTTERIIEKEKEIKTEG